MRRRREKKTEKTPPMMDEVFDLSRWSSSSALETCYRSFRATRNPITVLSQDSSVTVAKTVKTESRAELA